MSQEEEKRINFEKSKCLVFYPSFQKGGNMNEMRGQYERDLQRDTFSIKFLLGEA